MKLSFSTLGCPGWGFKEIVVSAKDLGLSGIEIRGIGDTMYAPDIAEFSTGNIEGTKEILSALSMKIALLASNAALGLPETIGQSFAEACAYVDLASKLGARYIRVMPSAHPEPEDCNLVLCAEYYGKLCDYAEPLGVTPLMETNGVLAYSKIMADFMRAVGRKNAGVLWDIHHPVRFYNEKPAVTAGNIKEFVRHVHVKDSVLQGDVVQYRMMGYGDIPVMDCLKELKEAGFDGYVSLEWVKRWNPDLQEPGIVFAHFTNYMSYLINQL